MLTTAGKEELLSWKGRDSQLYSRSASNTVTVATWVVPKMRVPFILRAAR